MVASCRSKKLFGNYKLGCLFPKGHDGPHAYDSMTKEAITRLAAELAEALGKIGSLTGKLHLAQSIIKEINDATGSKSFEAALEFHGLLAPIRRAAIDEAGGEG